MLVYGVEGERNAASLVKDSKAYIEIAKFVEAYTTIIQNPNEFLTEVGEEPINPETDILSWAQLVKILTTCDLGFDPVPTEKQLVSYYVYARQIGSISKEVKALATVSDVAEAQKHYYNFIDEETEKATIMYNKQHEIAEHRAKEVQEIDDNLKKKKTTIALYFFGMMMSVFSIMFGVAVAVFDILGIESSAKYVVGGIFVIAGIALFYVFDKLYINTKRDYYGYHKSTRDAVARSEKTSLEEKVLKDKLAKYERDLKVAKYELADKQKRFDVEKNLAELREKNRYYRMLRAGRMGREYDGFGRRRRMALINELEEANSESLFSIFGGDDRRRMKKQPKGLFEEISDLFRVGGEDGINLKNRTSKNGMFDMLNPTGNDFIKPILKPIGKDANFKALKNAFERQGIGELIAKGPLGSEFNLHSKKNVFDFLIQNAIKQGNEQRDRYETGIAISKLHKKYPEFSGLADTNDLKLQVKAINEHKNLVSKYSTLTPAETFQATSGLPSSIKDYNISGKIPTEFLNVDKFKEFNDGLKTDGKNPFNSKTQKGLNNFDPQSVVAEIERKNVAKKAEEMMKDKEIEDFIKGM